MKAYGSLGLDILWGTLMLMGEASMQVNGTVKLNRYLCDQISLTSSFEESCIGHEGMSAKIMRYYGGPMPAPSLQLQP